MSIQALPQSTVRALGATQALTDPASLVKELLDNALDANANSVAISISSNTLDVIQVRDNGHGIAPQDRPLVARRYCTSKICDDGDLKDIGGTSLGFRGEALASAAELSGSLLISTRIEGEQVATSLNISQQGEVLGQERASLPVGTTVKISDFIKANPVRRQVALKNVESCLKKIKRLLQAYAFARPHVRLSLQVLKAKNKKADWVYAPKLNGNAEDAAFKIVGAACASSCLWSVVEDQGLTLQAFLPRPDADVIKISNIGSFVSIDACPVSTSRGLLKQITKVFRESLKAADSKFEGVKEPFLFLEISGGSYDANLEPAKDDVLFENADVVLEVVKHLFTIMYKPRQQSVAVAEEPAPVPTDLAVGEEEEHDQFTSLEDSLPRATVHDASISVDARKDATEDWLESLEAQQTTRKPATPARAREAPVMSNMYGFDNEDDLSIDNDRPTTGLTEADFAELRQSRNDVTLSNPWVLAKMNTSTRAPTLENVHRSKSPARRARPAASTGQESSPTKHQHNAGISGLPTPRPSSPSPPLEGFHPSDHVRGLRDARSSRLIGTPEDPPLRSHTSVPSIGPQNSDDEHLDTEQYAATPHYSYALNNNAAERTAGTRLSDIPGAIPRPRRAPVSKANKPFVPPSRDDAERDQVWFASPEKPRTQRARQGNGLVAQGQLDDLVENDRPLTPPQRNGDIRDFVGRNTVNSISSMIERRNFDQTPHLTDPPSDEERTASIRPIDSVMQQHGFRPASELLDVGTCPSLVEKQPTRLSKRRTTTDRAPLQELSPNVPVEAEDEAEYRPTTTSKRVPSRRRSSKALNRTKSSRLPLERVPPGHATHDLIVNVSTDADQLRGLAGKIDQDTSLLRYDEPAENFLSPFDTMEDSDVQALTTTLHQLLVPAGSDTDVVDSLPLLEEVRAAIYTQRAPDTESEMLV